MKKDKRIKLDNKVKDKKVVDFFLGSGKTVAIKEMMFNTFMGNRCLYNYRNMIMYKKNNFFGSSIIFNRGNSIGQISSYMTNNVWFEDSF